MLIINNKVTILEHLTAAPITEKKVKDDVMEAFNESDKDVRLLAYRISLDKFNSKYSNFDSNQKAVLKEYINSVDNSTRLREFYIDKTNEIKSQLTELNQSTTNPVTKIKIDEIISLIKPVTKTTKVTDNDLINLLQYCDLLTELETANA